jgi:hypothetical protein
MAVWRGIPSNSQISFHIPIILAPESSRHVMVCLPPTNASMDRRGTEWCPTIKPASLRCRECSYGPQTSSGFRPASSLTEIVLVDTRWVAVCSHKCFLTSGDTDNTSCMGMVIGELRILLTILSLAVGSSIGNASLNCGFDTAGLPERGCPNPFDVGSDLSATALT